MAASVLKRFLKGQKGNVAILTALALVPMLLGAGATIDYLRASSVKSRLQDALDAGSLAVASSSSKLGDSGRIAMGDKVFDRNWQDGSVKGLSKSAKFKLVDGGVKATAEAKVPMTVLKAVGYSNITVEAESFVKIPDGKNAEIALVLDYSGSMKETAGGQVKYIAMREAAKTLVADLAESAKGRVKFGLVPFSHHVYATLPKSMVAGQTGSGNWTGCTQDKRYPYNVSDMAPTSDDKTKWGQPQAPDHLSDDCSGYAPNNLKILPLTDNTGLVSGQLNAMKPYAWTHIALGAEFGWALLSPGAPYSEGVSYGDKTVQKYLVILTDGEQTEPAFGPANSRTVSHGEKNLEEICSAVKSKKVIVMTVAFGIKDAPTRARLKGCATDPSKHYFEADTGGDIATVFNLIKNQIAQQVYLSK